MAFSVSAGRVCGSPALSRLRRRASVAPVRASTAGQGLKPELKAAIEKFVQENKVVLFMKGNRTAPQCGFSNTCVQILNSCGAPYETVNILEDEALRSGMKEFSSWPTFPQLYIGGEFFGGADITSAAYQDGSLKEAIEAATLS